MAEAAAALSRKRGRNENSTEKPGSKAAAGPGPTHLRKAPERFATIYDFMIATAQNAEILDRPKAKELYYDIAYFLVCFSMADLSHDFRDLNVNVKLDGRAGSMSIGTYICKKACAAFYKPGADYNRLERETLTAFTEEMGSDGKAKKFIGRYMLYFYNKLRSEYDSFFEDNSYEYLFESCAKASDAPYFNDVQKNRFLTELGADIDQTAIAIDSQNGNPMRDLFNRPTFANKVGYYTNFSSVLDPATKPSIGVEKYMKIYVQKTGLPITIKPLAGIYDAKHELANLRYDNDRWNIDSRFTHFDGAKVYEDTINSDNTVSVNNKGVFKSRFVAGVAEAAINAQVIKNKDIAIIGLDHHLKSCGDRYQGLYFSDIGVGADKIKYQQLSRLQGSNPAQRAALKAEAAAAAPDAATIPPGYNKIVFTLDKLLSRQLYGMRVNTVYCAVDKLTYYEFKQSKPLTYDNLRAHVKTHKNTIYAKIQSLNHFNININTLDNMINTLYRAIENKNAYEFCETLPLLKLFIGAAPPPAAAIDAAIGPKNFKQYIYCLQDALDDKLREITRESIVSADDFKTTLKTGLGDLLQNIDDSLIGFAGSLTDALTKNYFRQVAIFNDTLKSYLANMCVDNYTELLAHLIIIKHNKRRVNKTLYQDGKLFNYLMMSGRISPTKKTYESIREHYFTTAEYATADIIFGIFFERAIPLLGAVADTACDAIDSQLAKLLGLFEGVIGASGKDADYKDRCRLVYAQLNAWFCSIISLKVIANCMANADAMDELYKCTFAKNGLTVNAGTAGINAVAPAATPNILAEFIQGIQAETYKTDQLITVPAAVVAADQGAAMRAAASVPIDDDISLFTNLKYIVKYTQETVYGIVVKIGNYFSFNMGGGSRTKTRTKTRTRSHDSSDGMLISSKLDFMYNGLFDAPYFGISHIRSEHLGYGILATNKKLKSSKSRPVVISRLRRSRSSGTRKTSRDKLILTRPKSLSTMRSKSRSNISMVSRKSGTDYIQRQILAFFFLGYKSEDTDILAKYLSLEDEDAAKLARVHEHLFWLPFIEATDTSLEMIDAAYLRVLEYLSTQNTVRSRLMNSKTRHLVDIKTRVQSRNIDSQSFIKKKSGEPTDPIRVLSQHVGLIELDN